MVRTWNMWHNKDGTFVEVAERPFWAILAEEALGLFIEVTDHRLCCNIPEVLWKVPVGAPVYYPEDPNDPEDVKLLENSLAGLLYDKMGNLEFYLLEKETVLNKIEIDDDIARTLTSNSLWWVDDESETTKDNNG